MVKKKKKKSIIVPDAEGSLKAIQHGLTNVGSPYKATPAVTDGTIGGTGIAEDFEYREASLYESLLDAFEEIGIIEDNQELVNEARKYKNDAKLAKLSPANSSNIQDILDSLPGNVAVNFTAYNALNGHNYVQEYVDELASNNLKLCGKLFHSIIVFKTKFPKVELPETANLVDDIFEIRAKYSSNLARLLFFFTNNNSVILTNGFTKKTQKTPRSEIDKAKLLYKEYYNNGGK